MNRAPLAGLLLSITIAAAAACGSPPPPPPPTPAPAPPPAPSPIDPAATPSPVPPPAPAEPGTPPAAGAGKSRPLSSSKLLADLRGLGLDPAKLPALSKLPLATKKKVMPLFVKSLGLADCNGCHQNNDFKAQTRNVQIARQMWDHFVVGLRDEANGPVFCDSCHGGQAQILDRTDKDALQVFMQEQYENKLNRADGESHACSTCHGEEIEMEIFDKLWKVKK